MFILIPGIPSLNPAKHLADVRETLGVVKKASELPIVNTVLAYAGKPVSDLRTSYGYGEKKDSGFVSFLKRHIFTYGIIGGIICGIVSFFTGKAISKGGEDTPKALGIVRSVAGLLSLVGVVASGYSSAKKIPFKEFVPRTERLVLEGKDLVSAVLERVEKAEPATFDTSPLRFPKNVEEQIIEKNLRKVDSPSGIQAFLVGRPQTGKTAFCRSIIGAIKDYEAKRQDGKSKEVFDFQVSGKKLIELIKSPNPQLEQYKQLATLFGVDEFAELIGTHSGRLELLEGIVMNLEKKFVDSRTNGKRFVLLLDEFDEIMSLAKGPDGNMLTELMGPIFSMFAKLLDNKENDIFFTSNLDLNSLCGLDVSKRDPKNDSSGSEADKFVGRMKRIYVRVTLPDRRAKAEILGVYLKLLAQKRPEIFESSFLDAIRTSSSTKAGESELGEIILKAINKEIREAKLSEEYPKDWSERKTHQIYNELDKDIDDIDKRSELVESCISEIREKHIKAEVFEQLAGGYIEDIINRLEERGEEITPSLVARSLLSHPPEEEQVKSVNLKVDKLKEILTDFVKGHRDHMKAKTLSDDENKRFLQTYAKKIQRIRESDINELSKLALDAAGQRTDYFKTLYDVVKSGIKKKVPGMETLHAKLLDAEEVAFLNRANISQTKPPQS